LWGGDIAILNKDAEQEDESRIGQWLGGQSWRVIEDLWVIGSVYE
jgi:hypothetical protein